MAIRTYKVILDSNNTIAPEPVLLRQGDKTGSVVIDATLMDNGSPVSLEGLEPMFKANTADKKAVISDSTGFNIVNASGGEFTYQVPSQLGSVPGKIKIAYFSFADSNGNQSTFDIAFVVYPAADMTQESAKDWVSTLSDIIEQYNQWANDAHNSWERFVNDNKGIIESIDPGGKILSELIDFRHSDMLSKTFDTAKLRGDFYDQEFANRGVNVKWYGAVGDGVTDDTEAIQDVINKYENVYIPSGTYLISTLLIDKKTFVHGAGQDTTVLKSKDESDQQMINITLSASKSRISNLYLQGGDSWNNRYNSKLGLVLSSNGTLIDQDTMIAIKNVTINFFFDNFTMQSDHRGCVCDQLYCGGAGHRNIVVEGTDNSLINCISAMSMNDGIYVYGSNNRLTTCKSFMAGMSKTAGAGIRVQGSFISMANCELQENYLCNLYLFNCNSSNIIGSMLDGAGAHNDTGSLYYKDAEFNNASIPICNLRMHNCKADNISATIINGRTVNNNSWISAIGCYILYPALDTKNNISLTSNNLDSTSTDTYKTVDLPDYYWLNNSLTINGANAINDVNYEISHGFNVYSHTLSSGLTITNDQNLNGNLAVSSDEYKLSIDYPKNSKQLSISFDYDYDRTLGDQLFGVFDVLIGCKGSDGTTKYYTSNYKYLSDLMFTISISDVLPKIDYGEIEFIAGRVRFKNTSTSTTEVAIKNLKTLIVTGLL